MGCKKESILASTASSMQTKTKSKTKTRMRTRRDGKEASVGCVQNFQIGEAVNELFFNK